MTKMPYTTIPYSYPGSDYSIIADMNDAGWFVGTYRDEAGFHGYVYDGHGAHAINVPGATVNSTQARAINDTGAIAGTYGDGTGAHAFIYNHGVYTKIDVPGNIPGVLSKMAMNNHADVVGTYNDGTANYGYLIHNGSLTKLAAPGATTLTTAVGINDAGQIIGNWYDGAYHAYLYTKGVFATIDVKGATTTNPQAINKWGQVAGNYTDHGGSHLGFIYDHGRTTTVAVPGASDTYVLGINDRGVVVGEYDDASGSHGFVDNNGHFSTIDAGVVRGINNNGEIFGDQFIGKPVNRWLADLLDRLPSAHDAGDLLPNVPGFGGAVSPAIPAPLPAGVAHAIGSGGDPSPTVWLHPLG